MQFFLNFKSLAYKSYKFIDNAYRVLFHNHKVITELFQQKNKNKKHLSIRIMITPEYEGEK